MKLQTDALVLNSRVKLALEGKTFGFSCNFWRVENSCMGISLAQMWLNHVLKKGGAPSLDLSDLYAEGTPVSNGGLSSGVVPFAKAMDGCMASWFKPGKNSAGLLGLDITHPDLQGFLDMKLEKASKVVYLTDGEKLNNDAVQAVLAAYNNQTNLFVHKRKSREWGTNLCTEILMQHKDTCILGTHNLDQYKDLDDFTNNFDDRYLASLEQLIELDIELTRMYRDDYVWQLIVSDAPENKHVGLSVIGLANLLAKCGVSYETFVDYDAETFNLQSLIWDTLERGISHAVDAMVDKYPEYHRLLTQAPTTNSHQYMNDINGLAVSPGINPVLGIRTRDEKGNEVVLQNVLSKDKGNRVLTYDSKVETVYDVSRHTLRKLNEMWYSMFRYTEKQQSMSYEVVIKDDETFTMDDFNTWYESELPSLYYLRKIAKVNVEAAMRLKFDSAELNLANDFDALFEEITATCGISSKETDCGCNG